MNDKSVQLKKKKKNENKWKNIGFETDAFFLFIIWN